MIYTLTVLCCQDLITTPVGRNAYNLRGQGRFNEFVTDKNEHLVEKHLTKYRNITLKLRECLYGVPK